MNNKCWKKLIVKNRREIVCCFLLFFCLLLFRGWLIDCISDAAVLGSCEETVDLNLEAGKVYKQSFVCRGELKKLTFYLNNCKNNSGSMSVTITDRTGRSVKGCERQTVSFSDDTSYEN